MGVDGDGGTVERDGRDDVRRLAADARELQELVIVLRDFATVLLAERHACRHDVLRLVAEQAAVADLIFECGQTHGDDGRGRRGLLEQARRRDVHALVRALRREDDGDEQFERIVELERGLRASVDLAENPHLLGFDGFRDAHISSSSSARAQGCGRRAR